MYADIIIDISHEKLDKVFQYRIPEGLLARLTIGMQVQVPFGNSNALRTGYVVDITDRTDYDADKIKDIARIVEQSVPIESQLIALAAWMRRNYGGTMNQALKTVIPVKHKERLQQKRTVELVLTDMMEAKNLLAELMRKHRTARARLLEALLENDRIDYEVVTHKLNITAAVLRAMEEQGIIRIVSEDRYRNPVGHLTKNGYNIVLNEEQQAVVDAIDADFRTGQYGNYLIQGVTGSGKTEVYMELIARAAAQLHIFLRRRGAVDPAGKNIPTRDIRSRAALHRPRPADNVRSAAVIDNNITHFRGAVEKPVALRKSGVLRKQHGDLPLRKPGAKDPLRRGILFAAQHRRGKGIYKRVFPCEAFQAAVHAALLGCDRRKRFALYKFRNYCRHAVELRHAQHPRSTHSGLRRACGVERLAQHAALRMLRAENLQTTVAVAENGQCRAQRYNTVGIHASSVSAPASRDCILRCASESAIFSYLITASAG